MTNPDIAAIAAGLTKAQREAISASVGNGLWNDGRFTFSAPRTAAQELYDWLVEPAEANGLWACYRLTPLGLQVRAYLKEMEDE